MAKPACERCPFNKGKTEDGKSVYCSLHGWPGCVIVPPEGIAECNSAERNDKNLFYLLIGFIRKMVNNTRSRVRS